MQFEITSSDIKTYLGISSTDYDDTIAIVITEWSQTLEDMIDSTYLTDSTLANILRTGKMLCLIEKVRNVIPSNIIGRVSERTEVRVGSTEIILDNRNSKRDFYLEGMELLKPYLIGDTLIIESSHEDVVPEFQLEEKDSSGNTVFEGTFDSGGW